MSGNSTCVKCDKKLNKSNRSGYCFQHRNLAPSQRARANNWNKSAAGKAWRKQYRSTQDFKDQANAARREHYQENPEVYKDKELRRRYGISLEDKKDMYGR